MKIASAEGTVVLTDPSRRCEVQQGIILLKGYRGGSGSSKKVFNISHFGKTAYFVKI